MSECVKFTSRSIWPHNWLFDPWALNQWPAPKNWCPTPPWPGPAPRLLTCFCLPGFFLTPEISSSLGEFRYDTLWLSPSPEIHTCYFYSHVQWAFVIYLAVLLQSPHAMFRELLMEIWGVLLRELQDPNVPIPWWQDVDTRGRLSWPILIFQRAKHSWKP